MSGSGEWTKPNYPRVLVIQANYQFEHRIARLKIANKGITKFSKVAIFYRLRPSCCLSSCYDLLWGETQPEKIVLLIKTRSHGSAWLSVRLQKIFLVWQNTQIRGTYLGAVLKKKSISLFFLMWFSVYLMNQKKKRIGIFAFWGVAGQKTILGSIKPARKIAKNNQNDQIFLDATCFPYFWSFCFFLVVFVLFTP